MFDIATLMTFVPVVLGFSMFIVLTRWLAGPEPGDIARIFGTPWEPAWPRGVQEEELTPWRVDLVDRLNPRPHVVPDLSPDEDCDECAEGGEAAA